MANYTLVARFRGIYKIMQEAMRHWTTSGLSGAHHTARAPDWAQVAVGAPSLHGLRYAEVQQATLLAYTSLKIFPDVVADSA
jgi:hypothetical protein